MPAFAAQKAKVVEDTELYEQADADSSSVESLTSGDTLLVSNKPKNGFYKARARSGKKGYVKQKAVKTKSAAPIESIRSSDQVEESSADEEETVSRPSREGSSGGSNKSFRLMVGMSFFNMRDLAALLASNGLSIANGIQAGAEMGLGLGNSGLTILLRAELITKSIVAQDPDQNLELNLGAFSLPVSLGLGYGFRISKKMVLEIAGYGGFGLLTKFSSTQTNAAEPNVTTLSATPLGILIKVLAEYKFNPKGKLSLIVEAAYRLQKSSDLVPADPEDANNGDDLFQVGGTGAYIPTPIDFSGLSVVLGIAIRL